MLAAAAVPDRVVTVNASSVPVVTLSSVFRSAAVADALVRTSATLAAVSSVSWLSVASSSSATVPTIDVTAVALTAPLNVASSPISWVALTNAAASRVTLEAAEERIPPAATTDWMFAIVPVRLVTPVADTFTEVLPSRASRSAAPAVPVTVTV